MSALHNSGINDIFTILNSAWPVSLGGTGGSTSITSWDAITAKGTDIASASTIVLTTATGPRIDITGTVAITAVTLANGLMRIARATGIFVLTASATLLVNKSASVNYTTAVGDLMIFTAEGGVTSVTVISGISASAVAASYLALAGGTMAGSIVHAAGTVSLAPANFQAGPVKTTAVAGDLEFDGKAFYLNALASSRQVVVAAQFVSNGAVVALSNSSTSAQNIFPSANDVLTVAASTSYRFRGRIFTTNGATAHIVTIGIGGTATFTSFVMYVEGLSGVAANALTGGQRGYATTAAGAAATNGAVSTTFLEVEIEGVMRVNGAGTIIPQITYSAGPTGTCQIEPNSYFEIWPVGSDTVAAVGNWA